MGVPLRDRLAGPTLGLLFVLFVGLHAAGGLWAGSGRRVWGFDSWGRLGAGAGLAAVLWIAAGAVLALRLGRASAGAPRRRARWTRLVPYAGTGLLAIVPFALLRSWVVYGDGAESYEVFVRGNPLTSFLYRVVGAILAGGLGGPPSAETVVAVTSCTAGAVYVFFALALGEEVSRSVPQRVLFLLVVTSMGSVQLFFGYVEVYGVLAVGTLVYVYLAARYLRGKCSIEAVALGLAIAFLLHMSAGWFLPSLFVLPVVAGHVRLRSRGEVVRNLGLAGRMLATFLAPFVAYVLLLFVFVYDGNLARMIHHYRAEGPRIIYGNVSGGADDSRWVPLFETVLDTERYTMFSADHLVEFLNNHVLAVGFGSLFAVWLVSFAMGARDRRDPFVVFLFTMIGFYLLYSFAWNPGYAAAGDWDLFAVIGNCTAILCGYVLVGLPAGRRWLGAGAATLLAANWIGSVPWILANHLAG